MMTARHSAVALALLAQSLPAQLKEGNAADAPRLSPEEQRAAFNAAPGFSIELVSSEIEGTEKPVALHFDDAGRLWTTTATEYPLDLNDPAQADEARRKWQEGGRDRILVIDQPLGPGPHRPRIFADGLVMPMSVLPHGKDVLVAHGSEILRLRDHDGDGRADDRTALLRGFGVQDSHTMAHQFMWLPDGSVLTIQGVLGSGGITDAAGRQTKFNYGKFAAFQPDGTGFRLIGAGLNNTWGVHLQRNGQLWVQEANSFDHCLAPFEEGAHFHGWNEEPYLPDAPWQPGVGEVDLGSTGLSGLARSEDRRGGFPPEWQERFLIANAVTGSINSVTATPDTAGGWKVSRGPDLLTCRDRRFRPVQIAFGPDACLYVIDWYNPVISHNEVPRNHPARDKSSGRIWRIRHDSQNHRSAPDVERATDSDILQHLASPVTWEMRAAWHQIVLRKATALIPQLLNIVRKTEAPDDIRIHAVWSLAGLHKWDAETWSAALASGASEPLARELIRALRTASVPPEAAAPFLSKVAASRREPAVLRELARYAQDAAAIPPGLLAEMLRGYAIPDPARRPGVQGETLTWTGYQQAFLNHQLELAMAAQPDAVRQLTTNPGLLTSLPESIRPVLERRSYSERFAAGQFTAPDLANPAIRSAALACAESVPPAAALLRSYLESPPDPRAAADWFLDAPASTAAAARLAAAPLALRLLASANPEDWPSALDLAAVACTDAQRSDIIAALRRIPERQPALALAAVRCALATGLRDPDFFRGNARRLTAAPAVRAAAWQGWFHSAPEADKPAVEAELRTWIATLPPPSQSEVLEELASTETGTHFALNHAFAPLLAEDASRLSAFADELSERVPSHGRLAETRQRAESLRSTAALTERSARLAAAVASGTLTPDATAGAPLFESLCLPCHAAQGRGVAMAPPLDGSRSRDFAAIFTALIHPAAAVENVFRPFHVRFRDGSSAEGFLQSRQGNRLTLQFMGGSTRSVSALRTWTARYRNGHSIMPPLATGLTDQQLADLAAFVRTL
jgi:putative membrane-bound dehydrogenase-like protein